MKRNNSKSKVNKIEPKLEYLQDPDTLEIPEIMKPLYDADEKLRQKLQPGNLKKEVKEFGKYIKKNIRKKQMA